jgi:hypothetical protein
VTTVYGVAALASVVGGLGLAIGLLAGAGVVRWAVTRSGRAVSSRRYW